MLRSEVFDLINDERQLQAEKWNQPHGWGYGDLSHDLADTVKLSVLMEEVGEVAREVLEQSSPTLLAAELVQVAAVAVAWLESI